MPLPHPFSTAALMANMEAVRGRRIELVSIPDRVLGQADICGLLLRHERIPVDLILIAESISGYHRQRVIFHELAHMWCDDLGTHPEQADRFLPGLPPELLDRLTGQGAAVLARHRYDTPVEVRAEMVADLLHQMAFTVERIEDGTLRGLDETLSSPFARPKRSGCGG
ncbi:hypothetical protein J7F03_23640 [Streptomyces sp. ISL-43]|uniref:hypothetical protein n=1 Tax=Streptomyces sp. ISL-43 TaxID=2819183 RepID=UPI001BEC7275|nr:hypothetical protein [Streptomyces sp. ISL-43]MBT2450012.1 hypothetical protein [Streptomyces sp. ISL-43]